MIPIPTENYYKWSEKTQRHHKLRLLIDCVQTKDGQLE